MTMMPRIRTVKPDIFMHEGLFEITEKYKLPLQFAFIGLFLFCDKEGRFYWQPRRLKAGILPYYDVDMSEVLEIFLRHGFIKKYEHQGVWYGCIPSWLKHQVIKYEDDSLLPPPDDPNWVKPEPKKVSSTSFDLKNEKAFLESYSGVSPPEIENKNSIKNNELNIHPSSPPRACTRGSRASRAEGKGMEGKGREEKGKGEEENIVASPPLNVPDSVSLIFAHWQRVMGHPNAKCDPKRKALIQNALSMGYSIAELCEAITGCSITPHNRGENDRGERYDGLHIILRNCDQIDRFINNCHYPPRPKTEAYRKTAANVQSLQRWMDQKMQEEYRNAR